MRRLNFLLLFISVPFVLFAYDWTGGRLIAGKDTMGVLSESLGKYLEERKITSVDLWGAEVAGTFGCFDDGCYNGCFPTWKLDNGKLYLESVVPCCYGGDSRKEIPKVDLQKIFPELYQDGHVFAAWVSQEMVAGKGRYLYRSLEGLHIPSIEIVYVFKNGILEHRDEYDNSKTRTSPYRENDRMLRDFIQSHIRWNEIRNEVDSVKRTVFCTIISTNESGRIDSVSVYSKQNEVLNNEAIRVIKSIPQWEILYKRGKQITRRWTLPVRFDLGTMKKYNL